MILTKRQEEGLRIAVNRYNNGERYTIISGYAGTGKSTLVRFIIDALDIDEDKVCYCAYTGKAAEVLRKKGNKNAITLHKLLYDHFPRKGGGFFRKPKRHLDYNIIVVDEISMVPTEMVELLFSHLVYIICLGDPFQLPPIKEEDDNHLLDNPHVFLEEVMRQATESEIIRLSMDIRQYKPLDIYKGNEVQVLNSNSINAGMLLWADQILVATNANRIWYNNSIRKLLNKGDEPEEDEKVICLHNDWNELSLGGDPLVNGTIGYLENPVTRIIDFPAAARTSVRNIKVIETNIRIEDDLFELERLDKKLLTEEIPSLEWRDKYSLNSASIRNRFGDLVPKEFVYAYAITCHKAQGSEWSKVLVQEERFPFNKEEHARWLYTACTRAEDRLVVIKAN